MVALDRPFSQPLRKVVGGSESPTHLRAKRTLARWLKPHYTEVYQEYPVCKYRSGRNRYLGSTFTWDYLAIPGLKNKKKPVLFKQIPSFDRLCNLNLPPVVIFDVACIKGAKLFCAYEVVHSNPISPRKHSIICDIQNDNPGLSVYEIDADWILSQEQKPLNIEFMSVIERK